MRSGVYIIKHTETGRVYIGSSCNMRARIRSHIVSLNKRSHRNRFLQRAWDKYGPGAFEFNRLLICKKEDNLFFEQRAIDSYRAYDKRFGFNAVPVAGSNVGMRHSEETKEKLRKASTGRKKSQDEIERIRAASTGRLHTEDAKRKMSLAQRPIWTEEKRKEIGKKFSVPKTDEHKKKLSEALVGRKLPEYIREKLVGKEPWNKGVPMRQESKEKMIKAKIGKEPWNKGKKVISEETLRKLSDSHKGQPAWNKGKKMSDESREKMRIAALNRHKKKRAAENNAGDIM